MKKILMVFLMLSAVYSSIAQTKEQNRAKEGEMVWVIVNHIKDEAKADYLAWMNTYFLPAVSQSTDAITHKQYMSTRWLEPQKQNADKTWTFAFIMDPVVKGANYDIEFMLKKVYGDEKGVALNKTYNSYLAQPIFSYVLLQSKI